MFEVFFYLQSLSGMGIRWIRVKLSNWGWSCLLTDSTSSFPWGWCTERRLRPGTAVWANNRFGITKCQVFGQTSQRVNVPPCYRQKPEHHEHTFLFFMQSDLLRNFLKSKASRSLWFEKHMDNLRQKRHFIFNLHVPCKQIDLYQNSPKGIRIQLSCSL